MNHTVLLFSAAVGIGTGILFGLVPALSLKGESLRSIQTSGGRGAVGGGSRFQQGLLTLEITMTLVLLISGGLLVRSLLNLSAVDPGFDGTAVATIRVELPESGSPDSEMRRQTFTRMVERVREISGVEEAGGVDDLPFPGRITGSNLAIPQRGEAEPVSLISRHHTVTPGYLETMGMELLRGRSFLDSDAQPGSPNVMIINDLLARRYWPDASPLGSRLTLDGNQYEVVGVVGDILERHLSEDPKPMAFVVGPDLPGTLTIVARARVLPGPLSQALRETVWAVDADATLTQESTLPALISSSTGGERYRTALTLVFGVLATLLSFVGVFGVTAHTVSKRSREMGIRMALGAKGGVLVRGMVWETLLPGALGIVAGCFGAASVSRLLAGYLFGVEGWDPGVYVTVVIALATLTVVAAAIPAARAGRVDPVRVLREE